MIWLIARYEMKRMFYGPLAWVVLAVVLFILAMLFLTLVDAFLSTIQPRFAGMEGAPGVTDSVVAPLLVWAGVLMLAVSPLLTMRAFAEERQRGSLTLLTSAPVAPGEIVLGKFIGQVLFLLVMIGLLGLMPLSLVLGTTPDWGKVAAGLLGLFLLLSSFTAAGLYVSSLTSSPLIAAVSSLGLLLFLVVLFVAGSASGVEGGVFSYLSHFSHYLSFVKGIFDSADFVYYLLFILGFLTLTTRRLDNLRLLR
ncbi:MAG: ABC transporter permease [Pseudomonadota bacterium]|nr:ABC transporter permease [Pseudomonadota bacterium]